MHPKIKLLSNKRSNKNTKWNNKLIKWINKLKNAPLLVEELPIAVDHGLPPRAKTVEEAVPVSFVGVELGDHLAEHLHLGVDAPAPREKSCKKFGYVLLGHPVQGAA